MTDDIDSLFKKFQSISPNFDFHQIRETFTQYENTYNNTSNIATNFTDKICNWTSKQIEGWLGVLNGSTNLNKQSNLNEIISVVRRAVFLTYKFELRHVQLIAVIILLEKKQNLGRLLEITTGEGKSITIAVLAAIKVFLGKSVDIITASDILAVRDATNNEGFFKLLGIKVSNNVNEKDSSKPKNCYKCSVVYGSANSFQGDILQDEYNLRGTLNERKPEAIIIDEVDSMFIDEFSRSTYISEPKPGLEKLGFVFFLIWKNLEIYNEEECKKESMRKNINTRIENIIHYYLNEDQFNEEDKTPMLNVPEYLKDFIIKNIPSWIHNSISARFDLHLKRDYIIDDKGDIVPVDQENTGIVQNNTKYANGLHQFLQIKHRLKLTNFTLISNYLSNIGFFKRYISNIENNICGMTGTLGSANCKKMLDDVYHVDFANVPTFQPRNFEELDGLIMENEDKWLEKIYDSAQEIVKKNRAVLILTESIDLVEKIKKYFLCKSFNESDLIVYKRNDVDELPEQTLAPRKVILSTNLAGRGVDIKLEKSVVENGGLHVCLTFLSINTRVELQAFGRAARQGEPGTGQLILNYEKEIKICNVNPEQAKDILQKRDFLLCNDEFHKTINPELLNFIVEFPQTESVNDFKSLRNEKEKKRLDTSVILIDRIDIEDELFTSFCALLKEILDHDKFKTRTFEKKIIRDAIEERWALWLNTLEKNSSKYKILGYFDEFKKSIMKGLKEGENEKKYKVIENSYYIDRICFSAIQSKQSEFIKYFRQPLFTSIKEVGVKMLYGKKEYADMGLDDIIGLCEESIQKNSSSFIGNMNKALCLIIKQEEKNSNDTHNYYTDAMSQYEMASKILDREIVFWYYFQELVQEEIVTNKETIDMLVKKSEICVIINNFLIRNNIKELEDAKKAKKPVILVERSLKELLALVSNKANEELYEMKLKGLETLFIIKEKVSKLTISALVGIALAELAIGSFLRFSNFGNILKVSGVALITEGLNDLQTSIYVGITREFNWKEFGWKKLISCGFTFSFMGLGVIKNFQSEKVLHVLKKSPLTYLKSFIRDTFGYDLKLLTLKFTASRAHIGSELFLMCVSLLSRKIYNKKDNLNNLSRSRYLELSQKLNVDIQKKISRIHAEFAERARELDRSIDQINENNELTDTFDEEISNMMIECTETLNQLDAIEQQKTNVNNTTVNVLQIQNEARIVEKIQSIRENIEDAIFEQKIENVNMDKSSLEETAGKVVKNALKNVQEKLKERNLKEKDASIEAKLNKKIQETQDVVEKNKLLELKRNFDKSKHTETEKYRQRINSEKYGKSMIEIAKNKLKETAKTILVDQLKEEINKSIREIKTSCNAYTSNGDTYEYNSMDIEYISCQLFKEYTSKIVLCKPMDKNTVKEALSLANLGKYNMIFYDIGDLKWVAFFIIIEADRILVLCKSPTNLNGPFDMSVDTIKDLLKSKYPNHKQTLEIKQNTQDENETTAYKTGIQSLWDMKIIADQVYETFSKDPSSILDNFQQLPFDKINPEFVSSLRDYFGIHFLEVEFDKLILLEKSDQIKMHHNSQLEDLIKFLIINNSGKIKTILENLNAQFVPKPKISKNEANLENKILVDLHIDHIDANGQKNTIDYSYSYLFDFNHVRNENLKMSVMDNIRKHYSGLFYSANYMRIPSNISTNGSIKLNEKLKLTLYDEREEKEEEKEEKKEEKVEEKEDEEEEDSIFCLNNFLLILASLQCEDPYLNEHLAVKLFKKTKFYTEKRNNIVENFHILTRMLNETHELLKTEVAKKEEMRIKLEKSPMDDENYLSNDELELQEKLNEHKKKLEKLITTLKSLNIEPTEENIKKFEFSVN